MEQLTQKQQDAITGVLIRIYERKGCALTVYVVKDGFLVHDLADEQMANMTPFKTLDELMTNLKEQADPVDAGGKEEGAR